MSQSHDSDFKNLPAKTSFESPVVRIPAAPINHGESETLTVRSVQPDRLLRRVGSESAAGQSPPAASPVSAELGSPAPSTSNIKISRPDEFAGSTIVTPPTDLTSQTGRGGNPKTGGIALAPQPRSAKSAWIVRAVILFAVGGCLWLLYWSVFVRLLPITTEHREKALEMTRASDELERLRARWTVQQIAEIKEQYTRAQEALFQREEELATWEEETRNEASKYVLAAALKREPATPMTSPATGIYMVAAQVNIVPEDIFGSTNSPYNRLLLLSDALTRSPKRLDLVELSVVGNSNSISQAQAIVQLFSTEGKPL
jgi:hypothetical protein